jgi:hypothetical protein
MEINLEVARKLLTVVDAGLSSGMGKPVPGEMCVEAAVCYALGLPHGDKPPCVSPAVRSFKIRLNDAAWSSSAARAAGLRALAVAQLGSAGAVDDIAFASRVAELTIRRVLPPLLRAKGFVAEAKRCEDEGSKEAAYAAAASAYADAYAYAYADAAAYAYAYAAVAAAAAAADAAAYADADASAVAAAAADSYLLIAAEIGLQALREQGAPGVALWDQLQAEQS